MSTESTGATRRQFAIGAIGALGVAVVPVVACTQGDDTDTGGEWASGGTASMSGTYPDPFEDDLGTTCAIVCATTLGPCYAQTLERRDISEGYPGLPVRLAFRVVDDTCTPVEGAVVDIWHTSAAGLYSGDDAITFCTTGDADAESHRFFRGTQTTDAAGRCDFDTCFPGWYPGRAIHFHFQVRRGADAYITSQLFFPQAVIDDVFANHPDYVAYGAPSTTNASDGIFPSDDPEPYTLQWARMSDGAMQAWKTIAIRSSLAQASCTA